MGVFCEKMASFDQGLGIGGRGWYTPWPENF